MADLLIIGAEVAGRTVDVRVRGERIEDLGALTPEPGDTVIAARGGALLPGLHDHHLHLLAMAAARSSINCGPPEIRDLEQLARALRAHPGPRVRGVGYHESVAGLLDRELLDRLVADRPVRVQHRGGALWMLNTPALAELGLRESHPDGRIWRSDELVRRDDEPPPDLSSVGRRLSSLGITGVTDATPALTASAIELLTGGAVPQRLHLLGAPADVRLPRWATVGPHKILRPDHEPPDPDALREEVTRAHALGRAVAIHAVTRESLVVALAVLEEVGFLPGDRIEHASLAGPETVSALARSGVTVVTQPGLVAARGEQYHRDLPEADHPDLYRFASLLAAGVTAVASSDAPYANEDPWSTMAVAATRRDEPAERVPAHRVLRGLLAPLDAPDGPARTVRVGAAADLCLLHVPLAAALAAPEAGVVAATVCRGRLTYRVEH